MEAKKIGLTINGITCQADEGDTILAAAAKIGIDIPTLCHMPDVSTNASCGICAVEVPGAKSLLRACVTKVTEGMVVLTDSATARAARRMNLELILANHPKDCLSCIRNGSCELQELAERLCVDNDRFVKTRVKDWAIDESSPSITRDPNKCILCGRCVAVCADVQSVSAIDFSGRGIKTKIATFMDKGLGAVSCVNCGQCSLVCPTAAIHEHDDTEAVFRAMVDPDKYVVVQTAPAIRTGIGEAMGMADGALVTGKMVAALKRLGFKKVYDTQFAADLTIMEEGSELIERMTHGGALPMITSCSPGWIKFIEHNYPKLLKNVSTCKSPQQMFGAIAKSYLAEKEGIDPEKMIVVSIMPCTAKKYEVKRPEMNGAARWWQKKKGSSYKADFPDVDIALTTRELARMFKQSGIDPAKLADEDFDNPLGGSTGAATIFGATGGVMEAAVRTVYEILTGQALPGLELEALRGLEGIKAAKLDINGKPIEVAVAHGLGNARKILDGIAAGTSPYGFIEIMTCPGGCVGGGGQPVSTNRLKREARTASLYSEDRGMGLRKSHDNPYVKELYASFLEKPLGHLSHELLHTEYSER